VTTNKLIIQSIVQAGLSPAAAAERYGVSRRWVYELLRRYREGGDDALNAMSRRPRSNPRTTPEDVAERIRQLRQALTGQGLDSGAATIAWHLEKEKLTPPSLTTIHRILRQGGLVTDQPHKRPRSSWHRFEAAQPNETWQSDFTHWRLENNTEFEVLNFLDDHSRYLISCTPHPRVNGEIVLNQFLTAGNEHGFPASTLTDNGMVFTTRYSGGRGGLNGFEKALQTLGIQQKNGSPNHPQTQGKIERFHQTQKAWLHAHNTATNLQELAAELDRFRQHYNHERPHRANNHRTPAQAYTAELKASPANLPTGQHHRIRVDKIDNDGKATIRHAGKLRHLGIGRNNSGKRIIMLVKDADVTVIEMTTGEILGDYTIDPNRNYQPKKQQPR
jgi:transposase InsO family protein